MACGPGHVALRFDVTNPRAVAWAETQSAKLVTDITKGTREAIRTMIAEGFEQGIPVRDTAKMIRSVVGLTERDARAVAKRLGEWKKAGVKNAVKRAEKYAQKLLNRRALTIARTETLKAANEGQKQLWQQAVGDGLLSPKLKKVWITADPCPICAPHDGEKVLITEDFPDGDPPLHPNCRCTVGLLQ